MLLYSLSFEVNHILFLLLVEILLSLAKCFKIACSIKDLKADTFSTSNLLIDSLLISYFKRPLNAFEISVSVPMANTYLLKGTAQILFVWQMVFKKLQGFSSL